MGVLGFEFFHLLINPLLHPPLYILQIPLSKALFHSAAYGFFDFLLKRFRLLYLVDFHLNELLFYFWHLSADSINQKLPSLIRFHPIVQHIVENVFQKAVEFSDLGVLDGADGGELRRHSIHFLHGVHASHADEILEHEDVILHRNILREYPGRCHLQLW